MKNFSDVINRWPSLTAFAADIRVGYVTAQVMRYRNSIAPSHWLDVVRAAERRGYHDVTLDLLVHLKSGRKAARRGDFRPAA